MKLRHDSKDRSADRAELRLRPRASITTRRFMITGLYFVKQQHSLLRAGVVFFIQRANGEVAEWSKALPC